MALRLIGMLMLSFSILAFAIPRPNKSETKKRVYEHQPLSDVEHFKGKEHEHNVDYDHEAFLGNEQKATFDQLSPEESVRRLGILVEKIDSNGDGKITEDELKSYVDHTQKRYIYEDVDRQWKDLNPDGKPSLSWGEYVNRTYGFDVDDPARNTEFNYKDMKKRDRRRWEKADVDKDDKLTKDELTTFLHPEEFNHMKDIMVEETLKDIDKDKDEKVSLDEYIGGALAVRREIGRVVRSLRERQLQFNKEILFEPQIICQFFNKNGKYLSPNFYHDKIFQVFNKNKINKFNKFRNGNCSLFFINLALFQNERMGTKLHCQESGPFEQKF